MDNQVDPRWDRAIDMLIAGIPKKAIAEQLDPPCHRNSITNWLRDPRFRLELSRRVNERNAEIKLRRLHLATRALDRISALAGSVLADAERDPRNRDAQRAARAWLRMFRKLRREERLDAG